MDLRYDHRIDVGVKRGSDVIAVQKISNCRFLLCN
jgi:hypothetical protein